MPMPDLSNLSQADAIAALQQYYAHVGRLNPYNPYDGSGFTQDPQYLQDVMPSYGNDMISGFRPDGDGYFGNLTPPLESFTPGGQYGSYHGRFSADGTLDPSSVGFSPEERSGSWLSEHMLPFTLAVMGGTAAYNGFGLAGSPGSGAAGGELGGLSGAASGSGAAGAGVTDALAAGSGFSGAGGAGLAGGVDLTGLGLGGTGTFGELTGATMLTGGGVAPALTTGAGGVTAGLGAAGVAAGGGGLGGTLGSIVDGLGGTRGLVGLAGAAAGALGGGPDASTTSRNVPEWAQGNAQDIVNRGQAIADTPFQQYSGQRYAGPNDALQTSWEMANQASQGPSAGQQVSQGTFNRLQSGAAPEFGNATQISNQYIGQTTPGASNQYIGQNANSNVSGLVSGQANPYLGQTTGSINPLAQMNLAQSTTDVGRNALLGMNNPYLNDQIKYATGDITRNFQDTVNPQFDRMGRASGSFGNTGVEQARQEAQRTLANQIGRTTSDMRMQDYNLQAQLGEGDLARRLQAGLTDASRNLGASQAMQQFNIGSDFARQQANLGYRAGDLSRNMSGFDAQQNRLLDAGKFDANNAQQNWQTNLGATSNLNQFNASLAQGDLARNAQLQGQQQQFNANQGNFDITGNRNDWNSAEGRAAQTMNAYQGYDQAATNRMAMLNTAGNEMNRFAQQPLDFNFQEFMRQQGYPAQQLQTYQNAYSTGVNGQSVQSTPTGNSPAANLLGGATSALGLYNLFTQPQQNQPWSFNPMTGARL